MKKTVWLIMVLGSILFWAPGTVGLAAETTSAPDPAMASATTQASAAFGRLPLYFVENQGQLDSRARFYASGPGLQAGFSPREITLSFPSSRPSADRQGGLPPEHRALRSAAAPPVPPQVVRWRPVNLSRTVKLAGADPLPGKFNHFKGSDPNRWRAGLPTYGSVVYRQAYPGVDLKFYGQGRQLEYDIIVQPGANPSQVRFRVDGVKSMAVTPDGDLAVNLPGGEQLLHKKPLVYQENEGRRVPREGKFKLYPRGAAWEYGFEVAAYDRTQPLVIDPVLIYSTFFGGAQEDWGYKIAVDSSGNAYVVGTTYSSDFVTYPLSGTFHGSSDAFVIKINPVGNILLFSTLLGGSSSDYGTGIALDNSSIFVCGKTYSTDFPTTLPLQANRKGSYDAFVAQLNITTGELLFSTYLGGTSEDGANAIATDGHGNAYVVGYTLSNDFPPQNPLQPYCGNKDIFVARINTSSVPKLDFSTFLGGSGDDIGTAISVQRRDTLNDIIITGSTTSKDFISLGGSDFKGGTDAFVIEIFYEEDPSKAPYVWYSTCLGGSGDTYGTGIVFADLLGNFLVTGETNSLDFVPNSTAQPKGGYDVFLTKLSEYKTVFSTLLGGTKNDFGNDIAVDRLGNIYVVGHTYSSDFTLYNALYSKFRGQTDAFVAKFDPSGNLLMSTLLGGSDYEFGNGIAIAQARWFDNVFVTGETASADFPTTKNHLLSYSGNGDVFITKLGFQSRTDFILMMLLEEYAD